MTREYTTSLKLLAALSLGMLMRTATLNSIALAVLLTAVTATAKGTDPLPSWNDGAAKKAIVEFVEKVTKQGGVDFVPVAARIATFDNDPTLWAEQPMYFQFLFALDRVK